MGAKKVKKSDGPEMGAKTVKKADGPDMGAKTVKKSDAPDMGAKKVKKSDAPDFERAMAELEETVRRLEAGDLPLEESLAAFEKGVALVRALHARLDAVQMRIDELTQGPDGGSTLAPFAAPGGGADDDADDDGGEHDDDDDYDDDQYDEGDGD